VPDVRGGAVLDGVAMHSATLPQHLSIAFPGDPGYALATPWNVAIPMTPAAVVAVTSAQDVAATVRFANEQGLRIAVQRTGHGALPLEADDVLLIHTARLDELTIDPIAGRARVGAGILWAQLLEAAAPHGLAPLVGSAPGVSVVGLLTGGGIGPLVRTYGLSADSVLAFDVVTGDGQLRRATPTENPDLFWGLRGGKATLGIVTAVELELPRLASLEGGALYFDGADAPAVLHRWRTWSATLPEHVNTSIAILQLPPLPDEPPTPSDPAEPGAAAQPGGSVESAVAASPPEAAVSGESGRSAEPTESAVPGAAAKPGVPPVLAGRLTVAVRFTSTADSATARAELEPMRAVAPTLLDTVATMPYAALGAVHADPVDPMPTHEAGALLRDLPAEAIDALLAVAGAGSGSPQAIVELRLLGGALRRPGAHPSAFDHRDAAFNLLVIGALAPEIAAIVPGHAAAVVAALEPWHTGGELANFGPAATEERLARVYAPDTRARLAELAERYDPAGVLRVGQVVRTA
jgi:FAD/FMN-containing dehydrogenase